MFEKKKLLGVGITIATKEEVLKYITTGLVKSTKKYYAVTPNPEILVMAHNSLSYKNCLNGAELALPDGIGVVLASRLLRIGLKGRITGVDLVENLCKRVAEKPITVGFLGAGPGVAEKTAECLRKKYPGLKVGFVGEELKQGGIAEVARGPVKSVFPASAHSSLSSSNELRAVGSPYASATPNKQSVDILFVAFGSPKQELWIAQNLQNLPAKVVIGVGGAFDFISGNVKRAPLWIQKLGLEWLFRLLIQPWRIKRQLSLIKFVFLVITEFFRI